MNLEAWLALASVFAFVAPAGDAASRLVKAADLPQFREYPVRRVQFFNGSEGWAYGEGLWYTVNAGEAWTKVVLPQPRVSYAHFESLDAGWVQVYSTGPTSIYRTEDRGRTWNELPSPPRFDEHSLYFLPGGLTGWAGGARLSDPPTRITIMPGCIDPPDASRLEPTIYHTNDAGQTWTIQPLPGVSGCPVSMVSFRNEKEGVAASGHRLYYTQDGGANWLGSGYSNGCSNQGWVDDNWNEELSVFFYDSVAGWLGSLDGFLLKTIDGGKNWCVTHEPGDIARGGGLGDLGAVYFNTLQHGWFLGNDERLYETTDGGAHWLKVEGQDLIYSISCAGNQCWALSDGLYRTDLDSP